MLESINTAIHKSSTLRTPQTQLFNSKNSKRSSYSPSFINAITRTCTAWWAVACKELLTRRYYGNVLRRQRSESSVEDSGYRTVPSLESQQQNPGVTFWRIGTPFDRLRKRVCRHFMWYTGVRRIRCIDGGEALHQSGGHLVWRTSGPVLKLTSHKLRSKTDSSAPPSLVRR